MDNDLGLVTPRDASRILGVSIGTLAVWRSTGRRDLPYVKLGSNGRVKYRMSDLEKFVESGLMSHTSKHSYKDR